MALIDKLNEFKTAIDAIKVALVAKGVAVSAYTLANAAALVGQIQTTKNMGSKSVTFKQNAVVYGVKITESERDSNKRTSYIDNAEGMLPMSAGIFNLNVETQTQYNDWDKSWIFDKIKPCMLKTNGTVDYYLDPNDQTKKKNGGSSDISNINYSGNAMVEVEKFYTKFSYEQGCCVIEISDKPLDGFIAFGFIRANGTEADKIYYPMFSGNKDQNNKLRSISDQDITYMVSYDNFIKYAETNGSGYSIESYAMNQLMQLLIKIVFKHSSSTALAGRKKTNSDKTGILVNRNGFCWDYETQCSKIFWMEDFMTNVNDGIGRFEAGSFYYNDQYYVKTKPPYNNPTASSYQLIEDASHQTGYVERMKCSNEFGRYPVSTTGPYGYEGGMWWYPLGYDTGYIYLGYRNREGILYGRRYGFESTNQVEYMTAALTYMPPK